MDVDPQRTALVLIEYQNDFTTEGGSLHEAVKGVMDETGMLENTKRLVDEARRAGATIIHAPISFAPTRIRNSGLPSPSFRSFARICTLLFKMSVRMVPA